MFGGVGWGVWGDDRNCVYEYCEQLKTLIGINLYSYYQDDQGEF